MFTAQWQRGGLNVHFEERTKSHMLSSKIYSHSFRTLKANLDWSLKNRLPWNSYTAAVLPNTQPGHRSTVILVLSLNTEWSCDFRRASKGCSAHTLRKGRSRVRPSPPQTRGPFLTEGFPNKGGGWFREMKEEVLREGLIELVLAGPGAEPSREHLIANSWRDKNKSGFHEVLLLSAVYFL